MPFDTRLRLIAITDRHRCGGIAQLLTQSRALLEAGLPSLMLREKDLPAQELLELATTLRAMTRDHGARLLINNNVEVARVVEADGVHLSFNSFVATGRAGSLCGVSCHSREELLTVEQRGADYSFLSPLFAPISKEQTLPPLGLDGFARMTQGVQLPVIALGGVHPKDVTELRHHGAAGIATIGGLFGVADPARALRDYLAALEPTYPA